MIVPLLILQELILIADTILRIVDIDVAKTEDYSFGFNVISSFTDPLIIGLTLRIGDKSIVNTRLLPAPKGKRLVRPTYNRGSMEQDLIDVENINVEKTSVENKC